jgi:hypothetical protein
MTKPKQQENKIKRKGLRAIKTMESNSLNLKDEVTKIQRVNE